MIERFKSSGLVWPTVFSIVGLAVLVSLGNWQWSRMQWKDGLILAIGARQSAPPVGISELEGCANTPPGCEYLRVRLSGVFDHANERHVYGLGREGPGWHVLTPLALNGAPETTVWVNRGYVPDALKAPAARPGSQPPESIALVGVYRISREPGIFIPEADRVANIWYAPDVMAMSRDLAAATGRQGAAPVPNFYFDAEQSGDGWPRGGTTHLNLANKHLGYALTWWGLALTLVGVYAAFAAQRLSRKADGGPDAAGGGPRETGAAT